VDGGDALAELKVSRCVRGERMDRAVVKGDSGDLEHAAETPSAAR